MTKKVLLIGWDGADWKMIHPLIDAGKMPHLKKFIKNGVMGNLATLFPELSPMLWTSIATGKRPFKHGIYGFTEPDPHGTGIRPITILSRKTKAVWNILCQKGKKCNVVGWWPSHPAEPINGVVVSNFYHRAVGPIDKPWPLHPGTVHPDRIAKNLADLRLHPQELTAEHILPFVPQAAEIDQEKDKRLEILAKTITECTSIQAAATATMQLEPWDFMAVYFDSIDHFSHAFMQYHPPRQESISEKDFEIYKDVVEGGYRYHDMMLGVLLGLAGEDTTVMLASDHGFHPDHLRPRHIPHEPAGPAAQHRPYGIFAMQGPGIKKDELVYGANILDICPTILTLFGLPVGQDMDGVPLINAFEEAPPIDAIPSWDAVAGEAGTHSPDHQMDPVASLEAVNQLVALGYIEKPNEDAQKAVAETVRELHYNLARSYMDAGRHVEAIPLLEPMLEDWPEEHRFGVQLVTCLQALGRIKDARGVLEDTFKRKEKTAVRAREKLKDLHEEMKDKKFEDLSEKEQAELRKLNVQAGYNPYAMEYLMGSLLFAEGDTESALKHLKNADQPDIPVPALHQKLGEVYLQMKRFKDAERSFKRVLKIDPDSAAAHLGLCRSYLPRRNNKAAKAEALTSVGLLYHNPYGHFLLGVALHRLLDIKRAREAFQVAVSQNPNFPEAHGRLAYLYKKWFRDPVKVAEHRKLAQEARQRLRALKRHRGVLPAEESATGPLVERITPDQPQSIPAGKIEGIVDPENAITIVSGLPRSGTSMMMQMLEAGGMKILTDGKREADANNPKGYFEFEKAKKLRGDRSWLDEARGKTVKIVAQLLPFLPPGFDYRILFMERDINEVVASQETMLADQGKQGGALSKEKLSQVFQQQLNQVKAMLASRPAISTLYVDHGDCLRDPALIAGRVNTFLGGELNTTAMGGIVEPRLYRHRADSLKGED